MKRNVSLYRSGRRKAKRTTEISQSSGPIHLDADETVYKEWEDTMERAATTASSLEAEHDSGNINRSQSIATLNESFPQETNSGSGPRCQDTILGGAEAQIRFKAASKQSNDPPLLRVNTLRNGEDRMQLAELMSLCTNLQEKVLDLEKAKTAQAKEIASLKKRVKQLEKRRKSRTSGLRRLRKVGSSSRVESSNDASLGAQEDASKQGRKIEDLDADAEVTLVDETQEMNDDNLMFDTGVLEEQEIEFEKVVEEPVVSVATTTKSIPVSAAEVVTTASASVEIPDELTLAQTLIEIKTAKPKPVTTAATTVTSVRPRAKGIIFHDQEEQVPASTKTFSSSQSQLPQVKDKGKGKMVEPEVPLKKKDQLERMQKDRVAQEEASRAAINEELDSIQAMIEADEQFAARLQAEEQE
ncbi:hypothetical protein Tco_0880768 [Tanacetum coccineum]